MSNTKQNILGFIPARGGSKSIPKKNIVPLNGVPLMQYCIHAAQMSGTCSEIICSTDNMEIAEVAMNLNVGVDIRPDKLATDDSVITDVLKEYLIRTQKSPDLVYLIQPTSPFVRAKDFVDIVEKLSVFKYAQSAQTITRVSHNNHPLNAREMNGDMVTFVFEEAREQKSNKQSKYTCFSFGNLIAFKPSALFSSSLGVFAKPSVGIEIEWPYNLDVDELNDLKLAEAILKAGLVGSQSSINSLPIR